MESARGRGLTVAGTEQLVVQAARRDLAMVGGLVWKGASPRM